MHITAKTGTDVRKYVHIPTAQDSAALDAAFEQFQQRVSTALEKEPTNKVLLKTQGMSVQDMADLRGSTNFETIFKELNRLSSAQFAAKPSSTLQVDDTNTAAI